MTEQIHRLALTPELRAESPYLAVPLEVPPGTESIEGELCFVHRSTRIDIGCEGSRVARLVRERTAALRHRAGCRDLGLRARRTRTRGLACRPRATRCPLVACRSN